MEKSWMQKNRTSSEYAYGVEMFIKNGLKHSKTSNVMTCPCLKCVNAKTLDVNTIRDHLFFNGIDQSYQEWIFHGESLPIKRNNESVFSSVKEEIDEDDVDDIIGMFEAAHNYFNDKSENFEEVVDDTKKPLYPNCTNFTKISTLIKLYNLKAKFGWSDKSFTELLQLISDILPTPNECPTSTYEAKKILCTLGMKYEKIHACRNDCCLFRKEACDANVCPSCGMSRWKIPKNSKKEVKNVPVKVMWYFSPIPRFERMFRSKETSKLLTWHGRKREVNDLLQHPKDALSWKKIDNLWPEFGSEPRNLRLALSTDGVNPHGDLSSRYSCWPVIQHMESLRKLNSGKARSKKWIQEEHNRSFSRWLSTRVALALEVPKNSITPSLRWIAHGPSPHVATYSGYIINGYHYHTKRRDDIRRVQNSGVSITATTMQVSSSKDKNPVMSDMTFYGVIREIWEIDYHQLSFILFKCDWVDNRSGVKVDELGFTIVDLKRIGHKSDSFILATQAKQVFYVQDSANPEWSVVLTSPQRTIEEDFFEDEIGDMLQECGYETIKRMPNVDTPNETDDTNSTYIRHDCEGRWMEDSSEDEREMLPEVRKKSFVPRGPTTMSELALVRNSGQKLPIQFNEHGQPVGATSKKMQSYIGVCVRQQIPITYNSWKEVPNELKDKIYDCISMSFDLQPNAKHSILMCASRKFRTFKTTLTQKYILPSNDQPSLLQFPPKIYSHINQEDWESFVDARLSEEWEKITHDVSYRSTLWKEARRGKNNDYFDDATRDCASRIDELVATNKNEDILTDALGSKEHGGRVRGVGAFVSQSQYFNTVKGKEKMCHKEEDDSRCKSDKKRSNHSRSSIGSINIDLDADEDTPTNKGVEVIDFVGTPCQLSIGSINNIVAVATIVEDNVGCPNVKVLVDVVTGENLTIPNPVKGKIETLNQALGNIIEWPRRLVSTINDKQEHSTRKDVVYPSNYTDVNGIIKLLNRHAMNNMEDVDMIRIPMNELIFGSDKFVYLAREDLLHYCGMVEIGYMCILAYITFHWMLHVIDLRENYVYVLDSLRSKVNENIHGIINVGLKTWQAKHDLQRYRSTPKWRPVKEIDEIRTEWAAFVSRFVCWMIVFAVVLYGSVEKCAFLYGSVEKCTCILVLDLMHCRCLLLFYMEVYAGILGIIVCIAGELGIIVCIE
ncbi:hypothetical protein IC575_004409 [Cucumis melo]